ncbi:MAG TPA: hypothetical protein VG126_06760 [Thermoleophilaceae bacterium]|nr:hypothetical protein [Thermoleophilaceae bacterium]
MLFVRRPYHLSQEEADRWMKAEAAPLAGAAGVASVEVSRLRSPGAPGSNEWDWLVEMSFEGADEAARAAREAVCRDLVADMRLLGMRPSLTLADDTRPLET